MTELMEQPWLIGGLGILSVVILFSGWIKTGHAALIPAFIVVGLLFGGLLVVERLVQTEKEQVTATIHEIVRDVERNDLEGVLGHIHSTAGAIRQQATNYLPAYQFTEARVPKVKAVEVESNRDPPLAKIEFTVRVRVEQSRDNRPNFRFIILHMQKEDGHWRVIDYDQRPIQEAFQRTDKNR